MASILVKPVINEAVRSLCHKRYPGHPHGCPNYGKNPRCPPQAPLITDTLDFAKPIYAVYNVFELGKHVEWMRSRHPQWSLRQLRCCLYWQSRARKQLREHLVQFVTRSPGLELTVVACPEAQGVNVTQTMRNAGIELEWPPVMLTYQIALVGTRKNSLLFHFST